uniref:semaphorin-6D-like isoform X3 n=1 Tax=Ciona intestinalis TaxID=7719 RepID=UPI00089DC775|nr:semaphorin-6D-like isoform X3 [Ciona intestinalis]|eukprot:XP_018669349.1 semaphorin-6D-like isoform X3 [Ciona intestinalis]
MTMNECTNTVEEIAGLRRTRGVTVLCSGSVQEDAELQFLISGQTSESGRCPCNHSSPLRRRVQLPDKVNPGDDTSSSSLQLSYSRSLGEGSTLSRSIRLRLSSLSRPVQSRSPLTSIGLQYLTTVLLLLIAFPCSKVVASHSIYAKVPLTRTDVTNTHEGYRTFSGRGPIHASPHARPNVGVQPSRLSTRSFHRLRSTPPLDFQKLKVIKRWDEFTTDVLLVSGSNYVYMINASQTSTSGEISYLERLQWTSNPNSSSTCIDVGKQEYECKNFIRVVELRQDNTLYVCGTNSYEPKCRIYTRAQFAAATPHNSPYTSEEMCNEQCGCPQNPVTTSVALYTNTSRGFKMFSAAVTDFMGKRSYLVRSGNPSLKSVHKWLNDPSFVKLIEYGEKVYLFFREIPTSVETGADHLTTWSRVAQVCKDDMGGTTVLRYQWTTFLKARLTCSTQGTTSRQEVFHFNNLTSVSDVTRITGSDGRPTDVIFATFTTPWEWSDISMSAVCVYSIQDDIARLFDEGHFMEEQQLRSNPDMTSPMQSGRRVPPPINTVIKKIPLPKVDEPVARPTRCNAGVSNEAEYFAKAHQIMYESVQPRYGLPIFVTESNVRLTQIALDENAGSSETMMLYAGTEDGKMLRIRPRLATTEGPKSVLIEEMNVADQSTCASTTSCGVRALHISHPELPANVSPDLDANPKPSAFIAFTDKMIQVPLTKCDRYPNAACCNFDPECGWIRSKCESRDSQNSNVLPRISDQIPSNCQKQPVVVKGNPSKTSTSISPKPPSDTEQEISTAGSNNFFIAGVIGFLLGIIVMLLSWCGYTRFRKSHRRHNISSVKANFDTAAERQENLSEQARDDNYFDLSSSRDNTTRRPTSLGQGMQNDTSSYAPLTPCSMEGDKEFANKPKDVNVRTSPVRVSEESETKQPLLNETQETDLLDEIDQRLQTGEKEVPEKQEHLKPDEAFLDLPEPPQPPSLPPKKSSMNKPPRPALPAVTAAKMSRPNNNNNSNNNDDLPLPPLSVLLKTPEKKTHDVGAREVTVEINPTPTVATPPIKPPPPKPKLGLRKHQTFSAPHGQKVKPPVPPKSSSIGRAASMRAPPVRTSSLRIPSSDLTAPLPPPPEFPPTTVANTRERIPSYKHNASRPKSRGLVPVNPPVLPDTFENK